jgi:DNA-binding winged helix-turn-helix (wHTH) protein
MALYRFGYRFNLLGFDSSTGEVIREGCVVRLRPQPARVLEYLLERQGQLVSRGELQRAIWPEGTFVDFDHGLNSCVKQIRAAIGDSRAAPRLLETLVKRGFRFVAPVMPSSPDGQAPGRGVIRHRTFTDPSPRRPLAAARRRVSSFG